MGAGDALIPRPDRVPLVGAHTRITEGVRKTPAGFRVVQADDVSALNPTHRQRYVYDTVTGLLVPVPPDPVSFVWSTLTVGIGANGWQAHDGGGNIIGIAILLTGTGPSTTTCQLRKNGTPIGTTASVGSGVATSGPVLFAAPVAFGGPFTDYLQAEITLAGTGASGLTVSALRG